MRVKGKRRLTASPVGVLTALLLLTGCAGVGGGRPGEGKDEARSAEAPSVVRVFSADQLKHVALDAREVPGFVLERASEGSAGHGLPGTDRPACRPLVLALGPRQEPAPMASLVRTFSKSSREHGFQGLLGTVRVSTYADDGARVTLRELRRAVSDCAGGFAMRTGEGQPQRFEAVKELPAPRLGEEALAYRMVNAAEGSPTLVTVVRSGSTLSMFFATHLSDPGAVEIPPALVAAQVAKVERLLRAERPPTAPPADGDPAEGGEGAEEGDGEVQE